MASVSTRVKQIHQPRGGYIKPSDFEEVNLYDEKTLGEDNVHPTIVGMAVDYLTRYMMLKRDDLDNWDLVRYVFQFSACAYVQRIVTLGDEVAAQDKKDKVDIKYLLTHIHGLDDASIVTVCKLVTYDVWFRNPAVAMNSKVAKDTNPDKTTIRNIRIMVERSLFFWQLYGPIVDTNITFEKKGYTKVVDSGDGDFLTEDAIWDFKVSKSKPTSQDTLQVLMYWIMGQHSKQKQFKGVDRIGIFNPRLNKAFICEIENVPASVIEEVENEVICY